jgi:thiamine-monophosphate kinase
VEKLSMSQSAPLKEFELIARYFSDIGYDDVDSSAIALGVGDDCALLSMPAGHQLAVSIDTLVAGRHFPLDASPYNIARRALAVSISDLAAMGASPLAFTLALTLPFAEQTWLQAFSRGLCDAAQQYSIPLIGGDTTQGPLAITLQVHGAVPVGTALKRSTAKLGDAIFVSGYLGDAAAALAILENKLAVNADQQDYLLARFYQPAARIDLGEKLLGVASAAIDISDGLLADLGHIIKASGVAAKVDLEKLPLSSVLNEIVDKDQSVNYALNGGDDYELCFTAAPENRQRLIARCESIGVRVTQVGEIVKGKEIECRDGDDKVVTFSRSGYQHFQ